MIYITNQQPRPEGTGYVVLLGIDCMRDLIPIHTKRYVIITTLKGGVLNPPANKGISP